MAQSVKFVGSCDRAVRWQKRQMRLRRSSGRRRLCQAILWIETDMEV